MNKLESMIYEAATADLARLKEYRRRSYRSSQCDDPNKGWTHETVYELTNDETVILEGKTPHDLLMPATPGYELLLFIRPDDGNPERYDIAADMKRMPVIAWTINAGKYDSFVAPITPTYDGATDSDDAYHAVQLPDGRIEWYWQSWNGNSYGRYNDVFATLDEWIAAIRTDWARREREAAEMLAARKPCEHCGRGGPKAEDFDDDLPF